MTDALPLTATAALLFGLVTSVHCAGMCGPLACSLCTLKGGESRRLLAALSYHGGRLISYSLVGALCGMLGEQPLKWFFHSPAAVLPWALVLLFLVIAFDLHKQIPTPAFLAPITAKLRQQACRLSATRGGLALGLATPLIPCGPLYFLFAACLAAGSAAKGAEFAFAFGLGTVPLLWVAQHSFHRLRDWLPRRAFPMIQRSLALVAALVLSFRLYGTLPGNQAPPDSATELPSCCH